MADITINDICTAIATFCQPLIVPDTGIKVIQNAAVAGESLGGLTEGIMDVPCLQVYWQTLAFDAANPWQQTSFGGAVKQTDLEFILDLFASQRAHISQDLYEAQRLMSPLVDRFHAAALAGSNFDLEGVQGFSFRAERVTLEYGDVKYSGGRITVRVRVY